MLCVVVLAIVTVMVIADCIEDVSKMLCVCVAANVVILDNAVNIAIVCKKLGAVAFVAAIADAEVIAVGGKKCSVSLSVSTP